ncbi:cytochrome c oxidase subunit 7C, mitochondrial-like [Stylophora pistillata]|uniref:cytochrome c oxidase subunit 7C, mitochondrial-like n=1 Tax=Stylophora pistillata TaxID=50429 RepID=UPI000C0407AB|nr:cytochrome c oxidase subunit 7C, mitochondrial-like [Stylophora pistillata]
MSFAGRTLTVLGRSAIRTRCTALQRYRGDFSNAPGENMPFQTKNKPRLLATMILYLGTCFTLPFICVRFQMAKQRGD